MAKGTGEEQEGSQEGYAIPSEELLKSLRMAPDTIRARMSQVHSESDLRKLEEELSHLDQQAKARFDLATLQDNDPAFDTLAAFDDFAGQQFPRLKEEKELELLIQEDERQKRVGAGAPASEAKPDPAGASPPPEDAASAPERPPAIISPDNQAIIDQIRSNQLEPAERRRLHNLVGNSSDADKLNQKLNKLLERVRNRINGAPASPAEVVTQAQDRQGSEAKINGPPKADEQILVRHTAEPGRQVGPEIARGYKRPSGPRPGRRPPPREPRREIISNGEVRPLWGKLQDILKQVKKSNPSLDLGPLAADAGAKLKSYYESKKNQAKDEKARDAADVSLGTLDRIIDQIFQELKKVSEIPEGLRGLTLQGVLARARGLGIDERVLAGQNLESLRRLIKAVESRRKPAPVKERLKLELTELQWDAERLQAWFEEVFAMQNEQREVLQNNEEYQKLDSEVSELVRMIRESVNKHPDLEEAYGSLYDRYSKNKQAMEIIHRGEAPPAPKPAGPESGEDSDLRREAEAEWEKSAREIFLSEGLDPKKIETYLGSELVKDMKQMAIEEIMRRVTEADEKNG